MLGVLVLLVVITTVLPLPVLAQCGEEQSPCYALRHYDYGGGTYCRRYYSGSVRYFGVRGSITATPISTSQISQTIFNAYSNWFFNTALNFGLEPAGADTSGLNCRVAVIDNTTFTTSWGNPAFGGALAVTLNAVYPDSTIKYNRLYIRGDNPAFDWQLDCGSTDCSPYADFDFPGVMTHELGHWWELRDIEPPVDITGCDSVAMWYSAENSGLFARTLKYWDKAGVNHLYDTPTSVGPSFRASPGPSADTLTWEESDPGSAFGYRILVSDACWGPHSILIQIDAGDPAYTPDGRFYTYVAPAPYQRLYDYVLVVLGTGETSNTSSDRTVGTPPSPPSVPTGLAATRNGSDVNLSWAPSSGTVTAYYLYRHWLHLTSCGVLNQGPSAILGPITGTSYVDASPPCCDSLFYRVRAVNSTGGSDVSDEVAAEPGDATPPAAPSVSCGGGCTVNHVTWIDTGDDGTTGQATVYQVRRSTVPITAANWSGAMLVASGAPGPSGTPEQVQDTLGTCSPLYYYAVRLQDNAGNWSDIGSGSARTACPPPGEFCTERPGSWPASSQGTAEPVKLALSGSVPGVVRGPTHFKFVAPSALRDQPLTLEFVDPNGRLVRRMTQRIVAANGASVHWDLKDEAGHAVPAGVYFMRAQLGSQLLVQRLVVLH